jgi:hypothetical protein
MSCRCVRPACMWCCARTSACMLHVRCLSLHAWLGSPLDVDAAWLMLDIGVSGCAARTHRMRHTLALAQLSRPPDDSGACAPIRACARATLARPSAAGEPATCRVGYSVQLYACPAQIAARHVACEVRCNLPRGMQRPARTIPHSTGTVQRTTCKRMHVSSVHLAAAAFGRWCHTGVDGCIAALRLCRSSLDELHTLCDALLAQVSSLSSLRRALSGQRIGEYRRRAIFTASSPTLPW